MKQQSLTAGSVPGTLLRFSLPFLLSCFLQNFYGLADLFIAGQFNGATTITAVSVGSQLMHMLTVVIVGLAMGVTVTIGHSVGAGETSRVRAVVGNTFVLFLVFALALTALLLACTEPILRVLATPAEALAETRRYLRICVAGTVFITAYNVVSSVFRGLGDSRTPMYFVAVSGVINIALDYLLIGPCAMGAAGAAIATVAAQACSVLLSLLYARRRVPAFRVSRGDLRPDRALLRGILRIGLPVSAQDGLIQISFLIITIIANSRGVAVAAAVGIVEKLISFLFLVPSAMLSAVSAITAQNVGAGNAARSRRTLWYGIAFCAIAGAVFALVCNLIPETILSLFARDDAAVVRLGSGYLRTYVFDSMIAGAHFCFSGFFCAYGRSYLSFLHNIIAILVVRIPGAYLASVLFPATLLPMGAAAPLGSALSALICLAAYRILRRRGEV